MGGPRFPFTFPHFLVAVGFLIFLREFMALEIYVDPKIVINSKYLEFRGHEFVRVTFREEVSTEVEEIGFWIQTSVGDGLLFATTSYRGQSTYIELSLIESSLKIALSFGNGPIVFRQGDNLSDGEWHYIMFKRYGQRMEIRLDNKVPEIYTLPSSTGKADIALANKTLPHDSTNGLSSSLNPVLRYRAIDIAYKPVTAGESVSRLPDPSRRKSGRRHGFVGKMRAFSFNSLALFDILSGGPLSPDNDMEQPISIETNVGSVAGDKGKDTKKSRPDIATKAPSEMALAKGGSSSARSDPKVQPPPYPGLASKDGYDSFVAQPVTFNTAETFLTLPKPAQDIKMNIYFRFRTTASAGIVFYYEGLDMEFLCIELVKGHINYVFNFGSGPQLLRSSTIHKLDDNRWHEVTVSKTNINDHVLIVDFSVSKTISQDAKFKFFDGHSGTIYVGGVPEQILTFPPGLVQSKVGFQGCLASLNVNGWEPDLLIDSLFKFQPPQLEPGCNGPKEQCLAQMPTKVLCENGGGCLQHWDSWSCDCSLTGFAGSRCSDYGAAFRFGTVPSDGPMATVGTGGGGIVSYYFPTYDQADSGHETVALGFATAYGDADIMSVRSSHSNDYLEMGLKDGRLFVATDLGTGERVIRIQRQVGDGGKDHAPKRNKSRNGALLNMADGAYHVVNYLRRGLNMTLKVDGYSVTRSFPERGIKDSAVFNSVAEIYVGGSSIYKRRRKRDATHLTYSSPQYGIISRIKRAPKPHFIGLLSAVSFNGLMVLEEALRGNSNIFVEGDVEKVTSVSEELTRLALLTTTTRTTHLTSHGNQRLVTIRTTPYTSLISGVMNCVEGADKKAECASNTPVSPNDRLITSVIIKSPTLNKKVKLKGLEKTIGVSIVDDDDSIVEDEDSSGSGYVRKSPYLNDVDNLKRSEKDKARLGPNNVNPMLPMVGSNRNGAVRRPNATAVIVTYTTIPYARLGTLSSFLSPTIRILSLSRKTTVVHDGSSYGFNRNTKYKLNSNRTSVLLYPTKSKPKKAGVTNSTLVPLGKQHQAVPRRKSSAYNFFNPKQSKLFILVCSIVATVLLFVCCVSLCCCVCAHKRRQRLKLAHKATAPPTTANESLLPDFGKEKSGLLGDQRSGKKTPYAPEAATTTMDKVTKGNHHRQSNHYTRPEQTGTRVKKASLSATKGHALKSSTSATTTMIKFSKSEDAVYQNLNATTATEDDASSILFDSYTLPRVDTSENSTIMSRIEGDTFSNKYAAGTAPNSKWSSSKRSRDLNGTWPTPKGPDKPNERSVDSESDNSSLPLSTGDSVGGRYKDANGVPSSAGKRSERKAMLENASSGRPMKEWYV